MRIDAQSRADYFLRPRPAPNRLNPRLAAATRRSLTLRRTLEQAPSEAVRAIMLVETRQSSRIENVGGEPTPDGDNRPSRLYHALDAALNGTADLLEQHQILWDDLPADHPIPPASGATAMSVSATTSRHRRRTCPPTWTHSGSGANPTPKRPTLC